MMSLLPGTDWITALALDRMLYCLAEGTALALCTSLILRAAPRANSQTRFAVRLSTLVAIAVLPLLGGAWRPEAVSSVSRHALITIPASWAGYIMMAWMALAAAGLARVGIGLWQIRTLRRNSFAIDPQVLGLQAQSLVEEFRKSRPVSVLVSSRLDVPTAIGFFRPAVILPAWMAEDANAEELNHAILHELAHLRRRDDWTNLAQKLVKSVLFFHPGVWWVERKLSLDREMACDDAVLAQTSSARVYAQCLARVAEKSFLRRKMALAQAAVDRMKQLSVRVAQILKEDEGHPRTTKLWKPALPMVMAVAAVCAVSTSRAPKLVGLKAQSPATAASNSSSSSSSASISSPASVSSPTSSGAETPAMSKEGMDGAATTAVWESSQKLSAIPARYSPPKRVERKLSRVERRAASQPRTQPDEPALLTASSSPSQSLPDQSPLATQQSGFLVMVVETHIISSPQLDPAGAQILQINTWEVHWYVPARHPAKQIPRKT